MRRTGASAIDVEDGACDISRIYAVVAMQALENYAIIIYFSYHALPVPAMLISITIMLVELTLLCS